MYIRNRRPDIIVLFFVCLLAILGLLVLVTSVRAGTVTVTMDPFTIGGQTPAVVHFAESRGPGLFQAAYKAVPDGPDLCFECRDGFPSPLRPLGQFQSYDLWTSAPVDLGLDPASTAVSFAGDTITLTDGQPVQVNPGDFNADGAFTVQDIFDFLTAWARDSPGADLDNSGACDVGDVMTFLDAWFGGIR